MPVTFIYKAINLFLTLNVLVSFSLANLVVDDQSVETGTYSREIPGHHSGLAFDSYKREINTNIMAMALKLENKVEKNRFHYVQSSNTHRNTTAFTAFH